MVDECKQSTTTSTNHAKKSFLVNTFDGGLKAWMDLYRHCVCPGSYLNYAFSIYVAKLRQLNRGIPSRSLRYLICIITRGLCSYNARLLNDDVTAIEVSYWRKGNSQTTHGSILVELKLNHVSKRGHLYRGMYDGFPSLAISALPNLPLYIDRVCYVPTWGAGRAREWLPWI